ncbi:potassium-transporting ATPase subunit C [Nocardia acidivorans]|uniref:potassium-transporting ATPase subunit C n=1 Tax=Nocardia acidivorans TaxID=404580 RepID=UPI00082E79EB|nr:potassium-transporting ATPase subunit C [Nocardia acidivorans]
MRMSTWIRQHVAALRALLVLTAITGIVYPLAVFAVAQLPGLKDNAEGSLIERNGVTVGSSLLGQSFTDGKGNALVQYFQSRPSAAGSSGYDPTSSGASNLGPENIVDSAPDKTGLLTTVCTRSKTIGELEGVDGGRPFCTPGGVGAVLSVIGPRETNGTIDHPEKVVSVNEFCSVTTTPFLPEYKGVKVECAAEGEDYSHGLLIPIRGAAPAKSAVPADAVTASGSGLDPHISPEYADIQIARIAKARGISPDQVREVVEAHTGGRVLGFMGESRVNVVELNLDLDAKYPFRA